MKRLCLPMWIQLVEGDHRWVGFFFVGKSFLSAGTIMGLIVVWLCIMLDFLKEELVLDELHI